ncbi:MAG TPA: hypothetical protein VMM92_01925, partial [Thermoanaerobaculia bacterium]|nr:hypothetical protein [Thermoanaerobaculia bacterium]
MIKNAVRLPAVRYEEYVGAFRSLAASGRLSPIWASVADAAVCPAELPAAEVVSPGLALFAAPSPLASQPAVPPGDPERFSLPWEELCEHASGLGEIERRCLEILLTRALRPAEALLTYPLERLFSAAELAVLPPPFREASPVPAPRVTLPPDRGAHYQGYVCVILKLTRLCNLRCVYCHDWRSGPDQS